MSSRHTHDASVARIALFARRSRRRVALFALFARVALVVVALVALVAPRGAQAQGLRVKVRGTARLSAHAARDQGELVFSGSLSDDAGEPMPNATVTARISREGDPRDPKVAEGVRAARACDRASEHAPLAYAVRVTGPGDLPDVVLVTDEAGRFCFRARPPLTDRYQAHLAWRGTGLVDAAEVDLSFDPTRQALVLGFDPTPRVVSLDEPRARFEVVAVVDDDATNRPGPDLPLLLVNENGVELGRARTDATGRARFAVEAGKLGAPGRGELRVSFAGNNDVAFATRVTEIERHARVTLRVPSLETGAWKASNPEDGIPLAVEVRTEAGPVGEGGVEARIGDAVVGAAPVERGLARLTLTFSAPTGEAAVRLRYVATSPWYEAPGDTLIKLPVRGPSLLAKAPLLVAGLAVLVFFLVGRASSRQPKPEPLAAKGNKSEGAGEPGVQLVRAARRGEVGWRGRVADAHDGAPVAGARVWIERGTFDGREMIATVAVDENGRFDLPHVEATGSERLAAEAPLHARVVLPLPAPGELSIALVLRKRAVLARLVSWAKRAGGAYDAPPEPTPGHVRRAASGDPRAARWAEAVEQATFGGGVLDARAERVLEEMEPPPPAAEPADPVAREKAAGARPRGDEPARGP